METRSIIAKSHGVEFSDFPTGTVTARGPQMRGAHPVAFETCPKRAPIQFPLVPSPSPLTPSYLRAKTNADAIIKVSRALATPLSLGLPDHKVYRLICRGSVGDQMKFSRIRCKLFTQSRVLEYH